jgi:5-methylcytosine-specific restriction endonuclease McrA
MDDPYGSAPEPEELAASIQSRMGWGPLNCGTAVRANFCCEYCGKRMLSSLDSYYSWEMDHIIPGGPETPENYALACHACNHLKHRYVPSGESRAERLEDARKEVCRRRSSKLAELQKLRSVIGLPVLVDA